MSPIEEIVTPPRKSHHVYCPNGITHSSPDICRVTFYATGGKVSRSRSRSALRFLIDKSRSLMMSAFVVSSFASATLSRFLVDLFKEVL